MRWLLVALLLAAGVAVSSAQPSPPSNMVRSKTMPPTYAETAPDYAIKRFERPTVRSVDAYDFIADKTRLVVSPGVPLQVVYSSADGAIVLWFPDRGTIRRGRWYIEERRTDLMRGGVPVKTLVQPSICFNYAGAIPNVFGPELAAIGAMYALRRGPPALDRSSEWRHVRARQGRRQAAARVG